MDVMRILGCDWHIMTTSLTIDDIDNASQYTLSKWLSFAELERDLARSKRLYNLVEEIESVIKVMKAQKQIIEAKNSRKNSCICGLIG